MRVKRFPVAEDREFEIAGEVFKWVYPYWEDIAAVFDRDDEEAKAEGVETNGNTPFTVRATIADFIDRIELFIDPDFNDGRARWKALSKRKKNPIPHSQYAELYRWLLEVTSGSYPTEPSSPSEDGQPAAAATSTGGSS
jgi:hypothetical protein